MIITDTHTVILMDIHTTVTNFIKKVLTNRLITSIKVFKQFAVAIHLTKSTGQQRVLTTKEAVQTCMSLIQNNCNRRSRSSWAKIWFQKSMDIARCIQNRGKTPTTIMITTITTIMITMDTITTSMIIMATVTEDAHTDITIIT